MKKLINLPSSVAEVKLTYQSKVKAQDRQKITNSEDVVKVLRELWNDTIEYREEMMLLLLNRKNEVIGYYLLSTGGAHGTYCDPKIIFQAALLSHASGIILAHNHPSGNTTPSEQDIDLTNKVKQGGKLLEIQLLDHIILTSEKYYSFADEGRM